MPRTVTVYVSLWDEAASSFRGFLKAADRSQSVMLVTSVNPKLFGVLELQQPGYTCVDTLEGIKKKELVTIGDLNTFISNSNEQTQEADFLCKASIVCVNQENGWSFVSCTGCHKKLERNGTSLNCTRCLTSDVTGVVRFRVELTVDDGKDSATFVVFDKEMSRLTKQEAAALALDVVHDGGEEQLPACLEELEGKEFVFQIRNVKNQKLELFCHGPNVQNYYFVDPFYLGFRIEPLRELQITYQKRCNGTDGNQVMTGDVVGEIKSVKGFGISNTEIISPVIIRLLIAPTIEVDVALLDDAAAVFKGLLNSRDSTHSVMLITSLNPQKIGDSFYLVSTDATRFYSGPNLPAITEFTTSLRGEHDKELPILDAETVVTYNQLSSIGDLNMFLSNTTSQGAFFSCKAQIVEIVSQNGWYYVSCTRCGETLKYSAASLHCNQCHDTNAIGVVRYQVEILVDDGSNYATFLVLDKDMFKLTKKMQQLCLLMSGNGNNLPPSLAQLRGRDFVFHVRVTPDKFTTNTRPFTVCGISDILNNENFIINANKSVEVEYEEASAGAIALTTTPTAVKEGGPDISSD
ncbi:hypothetical protein Bca52824_028311 [Brassica carinata]|uniref:Replication factor A C-terminal domain-containing protein n=1 Tax=Brassica carinata TaxID=52824 RepID=A0A8X7VC84_BRACI|nr:hypothetical protein Bca52824_028311 [Brassica carinata]